MRLAFEKVEFSIVGNKVHLCESCKHDYPECTTEIHDVIFGDGKGNDNIVCCSHYEPLQKRGWAE